MDKRKQATRDRLVKKITQNNVYKNTSKITSLNNGLFAKRDIKAGEKYAEFVGELYGPNQHTNNHRSTIRFSDGYLLSCGLDDLASFANDCINSPLERRKLLSTLESNEPFYCKYPNTIQNSELVLDDDNHRAYLVAIQDIKKDDECWIHYGFLYWFEQERLKGFLQEDSTTETKFPNAKIFEYPAFKSYLKEFYPSMLTYEITKGLDSKHCVKIILPNKTCIYLDIPNYGFEIR